MYPTTVQKATTVYIPIFLLRYICHILLFIYLFITYIFAICDISPFWMGAVTKIHWTGPLFILQSCFSIFGVKDIVEDEIVLNHWWTIC